MPADEKRMYIDVIGTNILSKQYVTSVGTGCGVVTPENILDSYGGLSDTAGVNLSLFLGSPGRLLFL